MSIVDRLPELAARLPEEVKNLNHDSEVRTAARVQLWRDRLVNIERIAKTLPITSILTELVEKRLVDLGAYLSREPVGSPDTSSELTYEWFLEWRMTPDAVIDTHALFVTLHPDGSLVIQGSRGSVLGHKWDRSIHSAQEEIEQAIGFAYLETTGVES